MGAIAGRTALALRAALVTAWFDRILRNEQALREAHERLSIAQATASMGDWHWEIPSGRVQWSFQVESLHGLEPGAFAGHFESWLEIIHPEDRRQVHSTVTRAIQRGNEFEVEYRTLFKDDSLRWILCKGKVQQNSFSRAIGVLGICMDIPSPKPPDNPLSRTETLT